MNAEKLPPSGTAQPVLPQANRCPVPQQDGVLVLCKPKGITSAACIGKVKWAFGQKKIGHAGTLDPMATGVLLVLLGQATKISGHLMEQGEKTYSGLIRLGVVTDTWDAEGAVVEEHPVVGVTQETVQEAMQELVGTYAQEVPAYSAAKHQGKPLYELARKGLETPIKKKEITVFRGEAELVGPSLVRFRATCSSGTYIRSLAHSLGKRLGCGAMLEELTREYSHPFGLDKAHHLEALLGNAEAFTASILGIAEALPGRHKVCVAGEEAARVKNGMPLAYNAAVSGPFQPGRQALLMNGETPLALVEAAMLQNNEAWAVVRGLWTL